MNISKGVKSQGTLGTEGTRVHQVTDEHLQRKEVSSYTWYRRDEGTPSYRWTSAKDKSLKVHMVQKGRGYTKLQMDICKGQKSQGTHGTEGTRVHQVTDGHLQRKEVSRYTWYRRDEGTPSYRWTSAKEKSLKVHYLQKGQGYTKVQMDFCKGVKSQGTLGTEGTRVHQVTDGHQQWTKVSRYTRYRKDKGTPRYRWTSAKE